MNRAASTRIGALGVQNASLRARREFRELRVAGPCKLSSAPSTGFQSRVTIRAPPVSSVAPALRARSAKPLSHSPPALVKLSSTGEKRDSPPQTRAANLAHYARMLPQELPAALQATFFHLSTPLSRRVRGPTSPCARARGMPSFDCCVRRNSQIRDPIPSRARA